MMLENANQDFFDMLKWHVFEILKKYSNEFYEMSVTN